MVFDNSQLTQPTPSSGIILIFQLLCMHFFNFLKSNSTMQSGSLISKWDWHNSIINSSKFSYIPYTWHQCHQLNWRPTQPCLPMWSCFGSTGGSSGLTVSITDSSVHCLGMDILEYEENHQVHTYTDQCMRYMHWSVYVWRDFQGRNLKFSNGQWYD